MLQSFRVANHKSLREEQELNLLPVYDRDRPVLAVAAIYGANAAGKSNLVDALSYMRSMVTTMHGGWRETKGVRQPFRLDPAKVDEASSYAVDVVIDGVLYSYGFTVDDFAVQEEWLYSYPQGRKRVLLEREKQHVGIGSTVGNRQALKTLAEQTRADHLVLAGVRQFRADEWMPVAEWFSRRLRIHMAGNPVRPRRSIGTGIAAGFERHPELAELIRVADVGIREVSVEVRETEPSESDIALADQFEAEATQLQEAMDVTESDVLEHYKARIDRLQVRAHQAREPRVSKEMIFYHHGGRFPLSLDDESEGTLRFLRTMIAVLDVVKTGSVMVVDELETSLHPRLLARVLELFRDSLINPRSSQLIFTTHDSSLLGTSFGEPILGRDEIWFTEKGREGVTELFPLSDFKPRKGENYERRYLGGSYGAVPVVFPDSLADTLRELRSRDR